MRPVPEVAAPTTYKKYQDAIGDLEAALAVMAVTVSVVSLRCCCGACISEELGFWSGDRLDELSYSLLELQFT